MNKTCVWRLRTLLGTGACAVLVALCLPAVAPASTTCTGAAIPNPDGFSGGIRPSTWGDRLIYTRADRGSYRVYGKEHVRSPGRSITDAGEQAFAPDVWETKVAWEERSSGRGRIVVYDLVTGDRSVIPGDGNDMSPCIWGNTVVFLRRAGLSERFCTYDLMTRTVSPLDTGPGSEASPDLCGNLLAYENDGDIWVHDLATGEERAVVTRAGQQECPSIWGDLIAYADWSRGLADIWVFDLRSGTDLPVVTRAGVQYAPSLYRRTLVYEQYLNPPTSARLARTRLPSSIARQDESLIGARMPVVPVDKAPHAERSNPRALDWWAVEGMLRVGSIAPPVALRSPLPSAPRVRRRRLSARGTL